jgi:ABC-type transport system involved in cytochrome bd biosynthesis fused ATPase/permease subunit
MNIDRKLLQELRYAFLPFVHTLITGWLGGIFIVLQALLLSQVITGVFLNGLSLGDVKKTLIILVFILLIRSTFQYFQSLIARLMAGKIISNLRM